MQSLKGWKFVFLAKKRILHTHIDTHTHTYIRKVALRHTLNSVSKIKDRMLAEYFFLSQKGNNVSASRCEMQIIARITRSESRKSVVARLCGWLSRLENKNLADI